MRECYNQLCSEDTFIKMKVFFSSLLNHFYFLKFVKFKGSNVGVIAILLVVVVLVGVVPHPHLLCPHQQPPVYSGSERGPRSWLAVEPPRQSSGQAAPSSAQQKESDPLSQVRLGRRKVVWDWSRGHPCSR